MSTLKYFDEQSQTWKYLTTGERGPVGPVGPGVPAGGSTGQVLKKQSSTNQDTVWGNINKAEVGLENADNTSDANKPISIATQTALDAKYDASNPVGYVTATTAPVRSVAGKTGVITLVKGDVGLGSVDNTTDLAKPLSTAAIAALALKEDKANKGIANGYASLGSDGKIISGQLPALALVDTFVVASQAAMLALSTAEQGDVAIRTDINKSFILSNNTPSVLANWKELLTPTDSVTSVNTRTGAVTGLAENSDLLSHTGNTNNPHATTKAQVGLGNVDNTTDLGKPISTATQTALNAKEATITVLPVSKGGTGLGTLTANTFLTASSSSAVASTKVAPTGLVVGTTDAQTLTNKVLTSPSITTPTGILKSDVGLGNVDNTSDANKPISTATQTALDTKGTKLNIPQYTIPVRAGTGSGEPDGSRTWSIGAGANTIAMRDTDGTLTAATATAAGHLTTKAQTDAADALKVDKTSTINQVYATQASGVQTTVTYDRLAATANTIVQRTAQGTIYTATPTADEHATTKLYVDTAITGVPLTNYVLKTGDAMTGVLNMTGSNAPAIFFTPTTGNVAEIRGGSGQLQFVNRTAGNFIGVISGTGLALYDSGTYIAPTHSLTLPSISTGVADYNTVDQITNFERTRTYWTGNVYNISTESGGSGQNRAMRLSTVNGTFTLTLNQTSPLGMVAISGSSGVSDGSGLYVTPALTATAGTQYALRVSPTINQSGSAGYTSLSIETTETATGSGNKYLIEGKTGGVSRFSITNNGYVNASRFYVNSTAFFDGATAGTILFSGNLTGNTLTINDSAQGIKTTSTGGILRMFGGPIADGAGIVLGGSTQVSIPNQGTLRVGTFGVVNWTTGVIYPAGNYVQDLGRGTNYFNNSYTRTLNLNATASIDGITNGIVGITGTFNAKSNSIFGAIMPTSTSTGSPDPAYRNNVNMTNRAYITSIAALSGQPDLLYNADRKPDFTITSNIGTGITNLFNGGITSGTYIPVADLATTPFVMTVESAASIVVSDVSNLMFITHRLQGWGETLTDYKVETKGSDGNWYTAVEYTGVSHAISNLVVPLHNTTNTYPGTTGGNAYHSIYGIRVTISGATASSHSAGNIALAMLQLREFRPSVGPAMGLGALDTRGGTIWGDLNIRSNTGNAPLMVERTSAFNAAINIKNSVASSFTGVSSTGRYTIGTALDLNPGAIVSVDLANLRMGLRSVDPTHTFTLGSTGSGIAAYNTVDQTTNYERLRMYWNSGIYTFAMEQAGTGSGRDIAFTTGTTTLLLAYGQPTGGVFQLTKNLNAASRDHTVISGTVSPASGNTTLLKVVPIINQSGTGGYTALLINPTETTTGSGPKVLIDAQVGNVTKFKVANTGAVTIADGTQGLNKVLTSDADGNASWQTAPGAGGGISRNISTITSAVTIGATASTDYVVFVGTGGAPTLPTAVGNTNAYEINNDSAADITVSTTSSQTINGNATMVLSPNSSRKFMSNGSNWKVF